MKTFHYRLDKLARDGKTWEPVLDLSHEMIFLPVRGEAPTFLNTYTLPGYRWVLCQTGG